MRGCFAVAWALVLASLSAMPLVAAQDLGAGLAVDDPVGDTQGPLPAQGAGHLDIERAEAQAGEDGLAFRVTVASLQTDATALAGWELWLAFEYRETRFDLVVEPTSTTVDRPAEVDRILFGDVDAYLWRMDGEDGIRVADLGSDVDVAARTFNATVPWDLVVEAGGNSPNPGEPVRIVEAASGWIPTLLGTPHNPFIVSGVEPLVTGDVAPFPDGSFLTVPGAIGDLSLATPLATRFSNGEATTLHWPVEVANHGGRDLDVALDFSTPGAEGRAPPGVHLAAGEVRVVNVYATLPFAHQHGSQRSFLLTADSGAGDRATLRLGIDYPAVPQPAGHHPDLYLHGLVESLAGTLPLYGEQWMNTAEEDERSNAGQLGGGEGPCPGAVPHPLGGSLDWGTLWVFDLDPGLRMGLDGRMGETAGLDVTLVGAAAVPAGTMHARLALGGSDFLSDSELFQDNLSVIASVAVAAKAGPSSALVHLDIPMPPELDLVPPSRDNNMRLALMFCLDAPEPAGFVVAVGSTLTNFVEAQPYSIATGGHLKLPLDEYHDAIPLSATGQGVQLSVADAVRRAAPGSTVLWQPSLDFADGVDGSFVVRLFGNAASQARLLTEPNVPARDTAVAISFTVPDEPAGTVLDVVLEVTDETDPAVSAALRLSVLVDPSATADDAAQVAGLGATEKQSPGAPIGLLATSLLIALVGLRRRRR
jgi:hypothetical protein